MPAASTVKKVTTAPEDRIDCPSILHQNMAADWTLTDALMGGTPAMREGREMWLPLEPRETQTQYAVRLQRSFLHNGFKDTIRKLVAKPFSRLITFANDDGLSDMMRQTLADVDKTGKDMTQLGRDMLKAGVQYGLTHVSVDFPMMPAGASKADEAAAGAHPTLIHVMPTQLLSWTIAHLNGGEQRLTEIRFVETRTEKVGAYGDREVRFIRVIRENEWELWREDPDVDSATADPWTQVGETTTHTLNRVPLVTYYTNRTGTLTGESPLMDLAWTNLAHYQTHSDYRNGVRVTTHGLLMLSGLSKDDMKKTTTLGPASMFRTTNKEAKGAYVEHTGKGIGAAREYLKDLREEMELLGMQPLVSRSGDTTATGKAIDEARTFTDVQAWIRALELTLREALEVAAGHIKEQLPEDFAVNINNDFGISLGDAKDIDALIKARMAKEITRKTFLTEMKRRGVLNEMLDVDDELDGLLNETDLSPVPDDDIDPDDDPNDE